MQMGLSQRCAHKRKPFNAFAESYSSLRTPSLQHGKDKGQGMNIIASFNLNDELLLACLHLIYPSHG